MTTADLTLGFVALSDFLYRMERGIVALLEMFMHDLMDVASWIWRDSMRRRDRRPGAHRVGERDLTVWDIYHRMTDTELAESGWRLVRDPGEHRDLRGWRYAPATWKQIPVWEAEREHAAESFAEEQYWRNVVERLMSDIQYMLEHPPEPETLHGCKDCLCGLVPA